MEVVSLVYFSLFFSNCTSARITCIFFKVYRMIRVCLCTLGLMLHVIHSKSYEQVLRGYSLTLDAFDPFVAGFDAVSGQFVQFCVRGKITQYKSALVQQFDRHPCTAERSGRVWDLIVL